MGNEIGIQFKVDAQTDGLKRAAGDFAQFQEKLSAVLGITDPEKAEQYWQEFNSGLTKAVALTDQMSLIEQRGKKSAPPPAGSAGSTGREVATVGGREVAGHGDGSMITTLSRSILSFMKNTPSYIAGASRDVAGTELNVGGGLIDSAMTKFGGLSTAAKIGGGVAAGVVAVGAIGNALSKQYEAVVPQLMETTAALKMFGDTAEEQSGLFRSNMATIEDSVTKYGYTLQQGMVTITQAARGGAGAGKAGEDYETDVRGVAEKVMQASVALGLATPSSQFLNLATLGSRFKQSDALGVALGTASNTIGSPRAQEQASALATMFEDVMNQGVSANFKELGATQAWMSRVFGERAAGEGGAQMFGGLSSAVRASTSLSDETDILKYRAAMNLEGVKGPMGGLMELEKGFSVDLFKEFQKIISGASDWDKTFLTSKAFGVNLTTASQMNQNPSLAKEYYNKSIAGSGEEMAKTRENELKNHQELVLKEIRLAGTAAMDIKTELVKSTADIIQAILHPESAEAPMTKVDPKGSAAITSIIETSKKFTPIISAGNPIGGFGGDILDSKEYVAKRYPKDMRKGLETLNYLTNVFHDDSFIGKQSPDTISSWMKLNDADKKTDWSGPELDALMAKILPLYGPGKASFWNTTTQGVLDQFKPAAGAAPAVDTKNIFGVFEPASRAKDTRPGWEWQAKTWDPLDKLMAQTRDKFAKLSPTEREEALSISMSDKQPGANTAEQKELIRILTLIAKHTGDMSKFDVVVDKSLFK